MEVLQNAGFFAKLTLAIAFFPLGMAIAYVAGPTERRLALMRPFSRRGSSPRCLAASSACSTRCAPSV